MDTVTSDTTKRRKWPDVSPTRSRSNSLRYAEQSRQPTNSNNRISNSQFTD